MALVSGGTQGIGRAIVMGLAARPHPTVVIFIARDQERGNKVAEEVKKATKNENVWVEHCDLSKPKSIYLLCQRLSTHPIIQKCGLHVLVNNAAECPRESEGNQRWIGGAVCDQCPCLPLSDPRTQSTAGRWCCQTRGAQPCSECVLYMGR